MLNLSLLSVVQTDTGGPIMCQVDGSWFQAAVLSASNNIGNQTRADQVMVFTKLSRYQTFLARTVGGFLSPASNNNSTVNSTVSSTTSSSNAGSPAHSFFFFFHLLVFSVCLHLTL